jgi:hypothetical protein
VHNFDDAARSLARVTFDEEQRERSKKVFLAAEEFLKIMWDNAKPSADLVLASRALEQAVMWHSKAISNENKLNDLFLG